MQVAMLKRNERGLVGIWEAVIVGAVLTLIGFVVWRITSTDDSVTKNGDMETITADEDVNSSLQDGWVEYKDDDVGFSFIYPEDWELTKGTNSDGVDPITLTTSDFEKAQIDTVYPTIEGAEISIAILEDPDVTTTEEMLAVVDIESPDLYPSVFAIYMGGPSVFDLGFIQGLRWDSCGHFLVTDCYTFVHNQKVFWVTFDEPSEFYREEYDTKTPIGEYLDEFDMFMDSWELS